MVCRAFWETGIRHLRGGLELSHFLIGRVHLGGLGDHSLRLRAGYAQQLVHFLTLLGQLPGLVDSCDLPLRPDFDFFTLLCGVVHRWVVQEVLVLIERRQELFGGLERGGRGRYSSRHWIDFDLRGWGFLKRGFLQDRGVVTQCDLGPRSFRGHGLGQCDLLGHREVRRLEDEVGYLGAFEVQVVVLVAIEAVDVVTAQRVRERGDVVGTTDEAGCTRWGFIVDPLHMGRPCSSTHARLESLHTGSKVVAQQPHQLAAALLRFLHGGHLRLGADTVGRLVGAGAVALVGVIVGHRAGFLLLLEVERGCVVAVGQGVCGTEGTRSTAGIRSWSLYVARLVQLRLATLARSRDVRRAHGVLRRTSPPRSADRGVFRFSDGLELIRRLDPLEVVNHKPVTVLIFPNSLLLLIRPRHQLLFTLLRVFLPPELHVAVRHRLQLQVLGDRLTERLPLALGVHARGQLRVYLAAVHDGGDAFHQVLEVGLVFVPGLGRFLVPRLSTVERALRTHPAYQAGSWNVQAAVLTGLAHHVRLERDEVGAVDDLRVGALVLGAPVHGEVPGALAGAAEAHQLTQLDLTWVAVGCHLGDNDVMRAQVVLRRFHDCHAVTGAEVRDGAPALLRLVLGDAFLGGCRSAALQRGHLLGVFLGAEPGHLVGDGPVGQVRLLAQVLALHQRSTFTRSVLAQVVAVHGQHLGGLVPEVVHHVHGGPSADHVARPDRLLHPRDVFVQLPLTGLAAVVHVRAGLRVHLARGQAVRGTGGVLFAQLLRGTFFLGLGHFLERRERITRLV